MGMIVQVLTHTLDLYAQRGTPLLDRFLLDSAAARFRGGQGIVQFARDKYSNEARLFASFSIHLHAFHVSGKERTPKGQGDINLDTFQAFSRL